ncbi:MAG: PcfJ domain-containing protein [Spartobacteria bacterium]
MSSPKLSERSSKRNTFVQIQVLAELGEEILVLSPQGFLLIFRERTSDMLARQLRYFDAEEWRDPVEMVQLFPIELEGLVERERMHDAADLFALCSSEVLALLNQEILNFSGSNVEFYNYIHSSDPFRVKARLQALTVLPMLKWEFANINKVSDRIRCRIDAGQSVWDAYLEFHPGKVSILRRLATTQASPAPWRGNLEGLLDVLDPVAPEKVPCNDEEWNAFHSIYVGMNNFNDRFDFHVSYGRRELHRSVKKRWFVESSRMGWTNAYQKFAAIEGGTDAIRDTFDFLDAIGNAGDFLARRRSQGKKVCKEEYQRNSTERWLKAPQTFGMFRLVEWSARWHRMMWDYAGISDRRDENLNKWPLLLPNRVPLSPTVQAVSLGTPRALAEEGQRMQHCVGGYSTPCFLGESHIISLRDSEDNSLSTLEIRLDKYDARQMKIVQHKGYRNRSPERALICLEANLRSAIQKNADFKALATRQKKAARIYKLLQSRDGLLGEEFGQQAVDRVSAAMGQDRLMRLFQSEDQS